jgi:hypothetical protein
VEFTITEADKGGYHQLTVVGTVEYRSGQSLHPEVIAVVGKHPGAIFLLDITKLEGRPDVLQSIQTVEAMPRETLESIRKLAILDDISNRTSAIISEMMMINRGLNVKFFFEKAMAVGWLMK